VIREIGLLLMTPRYKHTQIGYVWIISLVAMLIYTSYFIILIGFNPVLIILIILFVTFAICLALFPTLSIEINENNLKIRFGPGIIKKNFLLRDIESCKMVKNHWYYGWGIHLTPHGWLYNISGFLAVEIQMKSGKKYRIGTDEPKKFIKAIQQSLG